MSIFSNLFNKDLQNELDKVKRVNAELQCRNNQLDRKNAELQSENSQLNSANVNLKDELDQLKRVNAELQSKNNQLNNMDINLKSRLDLLNNLLQSDYTKVECLKLEKQITTDNQSLTIVFILICTAALGDAYAGQMFTAVEEFIDEIRWFAKKQKLNISIDMLINAEEIYWQTDKAVPLDEYEWRAPSVGGKFQSSEVFSALSRRLNNYADDEYVPNFYLFSGEIRPELDCNDYQNLIKQPIYSEAVRNSVALKKKIDFFNEFSILSENIFSSYTPECLRKGLCIKQNPYNIIDKTIASIIKFRTDFQTIKNEKSSLSTELQNIKGEKENLITELHSVTKERTRFHTELQILRNQNDRLYTELQNIKGEKEKIRNDLETIKGEKAKLSIALKTMTNEKTKLSVELNPLINHPVMQSSKNNNLTIAFILICTKALGKKVACIRSEIQSFVSELIEFENENYINVYIDLLINSNNEVYWETEYAVPIEEFECPELNASGLIKSEMVFTKLKERIKNYKQDDYFPIFYLFGGKLSPNMNSTAYKDLISQYFFQHSNRHIVIPHIIEYEPGHAFLNSFTTSKNYLICNSSDLKESIELRHNTLKL